MNNIDLTSDTLVGLVDLHTHPAANLGFGTELFYGAPFEDPNQVFNDCSNSHSFDALKQQGNFIREQVVNQIAAQGFAPDWDHNRSGWPVFPSWPTWHDRLHQQVRVEMLERAWKGGLRLIVALAVSNHTLAKLCQTVGPYDDKSSGDDQIAMIKRMVSGQTFMELALSPSDLRQIIGRGHLAVILGVELDSIGNFYSPNKDDSGNSSAPFNPQPSDDEIRAEITRLFLSGVRYFFPVHVVDNIFGGAALYEMGFQGGNRYQFGSFYEAEPAPSDSNIGFILDPANPADNFWDAVLSVLEAGYELATLGFNADSYPAGPPTKTGHRNARGLQQKGQVVLDALMRVGAMIDIDHMGEKTVFDALDFTSAASTTNAAKPPVSYPLFAGHNHIRSSGGNERAHLIHVAQEIVHRGGVFGVGIKDGLNLVHVAIGQLVSSFTPRAGGVALGSDCSGMEQLPAQRPDTDDPAKFVVYNDMPGASPDALERCQLGNRKEDIDRFGFSSIGMYPDFIEDGISSGELIETDVIELFKAPEAVASGWESCLKIASQMG